MEEIFVADKNDRRYPVEWVEELSDMKNDISFLKLKRPKFKSLEYMAVTYLAASVTVIGFPRDEVDRLPEGRPEPGKLSDDTFSIKWKGETRAGTQKWNEKPPKNIQVYIFNGKFDVGYSGAPVCYQNDYRVIGMFHAKDNNHGYVIPMETVMNNYLEKKETAAQSTIVKSVLKDIEASSKFTTGGYYNLWTISVGIARLYSSKRINEEEFSLLRNKLQETDLTYGGTLVSPFSNSKNRTDEIVQMITDDIENTHKWIFQS
jgi:hypothetical protein